MLLYNYYLKYYQSEDRNHVDIPSYIAKYLEFIRQLELSKERLSVSLFKKITLHHSPVVYLGNQTR